MCIRDSRHRIERIGGDRICDSALTAASSMMVLSSAKPPREVDMRKGFGKSREAEAFDGGLAVPEYQQSSAVG